MISEKFDALIRFFIYLLIAVLPFSKAGIEICIIILIGLWILKRISLLFQKKDRDEPKFKVIISGIKPKKTLLGLPLAAFVLIAFISIFFSIDFKNSMSAFFTKTVEGIALYLIMVEAIVKKKHVSMIIGLLLTATVVVFFDGIIQGFFTGKDIFRQQTMTLGGITAAFNHKNDLGVFMILPLTIAITLLLKRIYIKGKSFLSAGNRLKSVCLIGLITLYFTTLILTKSRGSYISFIFSLIILIFLIKKRTVLTFIVIIFLLLPFSLLASSKATGQFRLSSDQIYNHMLARVGHWEDALFLIKQRPLTGYGINTYMQLVDKTRIEKNYPRLFPAYAHNCYLQIVAEMGIFGLLSFLWIIAVLFYQIILKIMRSQSEERFLLTGLACGLFGFLTHSFIDTDLYSLQLNIMFWFFVGLSICEHGLINHNKGEQDELEE